MPQSSEAVLMVKRRRAGRLHRDCVTVLTDDGGETPSSGLLFVLPRASQQEE